MSKRSFDADFMAAEGSASNSKQPNSLFVSFSKRRKGLFNKASELCKYCGAEVAVLVLSPTGNPFAFGHSSVDAVLHRYYLRQIMQLNSTNYPLMITGAGITGRVDAFSDEHRNQAQQVKALKARVKQAQCGEGSTLRELKAWIEKAWESCKTLEEFEFLKQRCLALLENVRTRLSSFPGEGKAVQQTSNTVVGPVLDNYVSENMISGTEFPGINESVGMAANGFFQHPGGGDSSDEEHVIADLHPLAATGLQTDMPYLSQNFDYPFQECEVPVDKTSNYGSGTTDRNLDKYFNQCLVKVEFDDQYGNAGIGQYSVGIPGNGGFFPHLGGESSAADVYSNVRPLAVMGPSSDLSYNSIEEFGYGPSYGDTVGLSYDQVPSFCLDALETGDMKLQTF